MKKLLILLVALAVIRASAIVVVPTQRIGAESEVTLPTSALWEKNVNIRPGNGEQVTLNPPRFTWPAYYPMTNTGDTIQRTFQFQASYDPDFANPVVNVRTLSTMYNFLAPFTNSPVYWRVAYISVRSGETNYWITNSFTVAPDATVWDRSMLADPTYRSQKLQHPYMLFNGENVADMSQWFRTNTNSFRWYKGYTGYMFTNMMKLASQTITNSWWPGTIPAPNVVDEASWSYDIAAVAFAWQMTGNSTYLNANPQQALALCASNFVANYGPNVDYIVIQKYSTELESLAYGYDWLYQVMTPDQRATVLRALDLRSQFILYGSGTFYVPDFSLWGNYAPTNYVYSPPFSQRYFSQLQGGTSHEIDNFYYSMEAALAGMAESTNCGLLSDLGLNYMIGCVNNSGSAHMDDGQDEGDEYGPGHLFGGGGAIYVHMLAQTVFPEAQFNLNPFWQRSVDFWDRWLPVGFTSIHDPWGDGQGLTATVNQWRWNNFGRMLSEFTGNGVAYQHWVAQTQFYGDSTQDNYTKLPLLYYYQTNPAPTIDPDRTGQLFTNSGWMVSSTYGANTTNCFQNGVGITFQARPQGSDEGHSYFSDLSFQIWAYGANVTDAGAGMSDFGRAGWCHYSLLINGLGPAQPLGAALYPYYSKFIGFADTTNYTYVAADATAAYPHSNFQPGGWMVPTQFAALETGAPLAFVTKVQRHILFMRKKYFVMFDDLAALKPATYCWTYPIYPDTLTLQTNGENIGFSYVCTNQSGGQVNVQVVHVGSPQQLYLLDEAGTNAAGNPITGENYYNQGGITSPRAHCIWVTNAGPSTNFHFMTVIYPAAPGSPPAQITRLDDYTVAVTNGSEGDVITFNPTPQTPVTMIVDEPTISSAGACDDVTFTTNVVPVTPPPSSGSSPSGGTVNTTPKGLPAPSNLHIVLREAAYVTPTVTNGMVGWWRFDEGAGSDASDTGGSQNLGSLVNSPTWVPGEIGTALALNGTNEYVQTSSIINAPLVTLSAWVNIPAMPQSQETVVGFDDGFNARHEDKVLFIGTDGKPYFYISAHSSPTTSAPASAITPGVWTHLAATYDGANLVVYMNGQQVGGATTSGNSDATYVHPDIFVGAPIGIGRFGYFAGAIDDVRVYNRALSAQEINSIYNWRGP